MAQRQPDTPEIARARDERYRRRSGEHVKRYLASDGANGYDDNSHKAPTLLLTTTGRRSGRPVTSPLYYGERGGRYVVIASYEGADSHPKWYLNLRERPDVQVQIRGERFPAIARDATGDEYESWWTLMAGRYPFYATYRRRAHRTIPVVVIERAAEVAAFGEDPE